MDYFNRKERVNQKRFAMFRDRVLKHIIVFLVKRNISKNMASFIGVVFLIIACLLNPYQYWHGVLIGLFLYLFFDALDGGIARYTETGNKNGSIIDIICDQLGVVLLTASSMFFYETNSIVSLFYASSYISFIVLVVYLNQQNSNMIPFIRVKYIFYLLYLITPFIGDEILDCFLVIFSIYYSIMFIVFVKYLI